MSAAGGGCHIIINMYCTHNPANACTGAWKCAAELGKQKNELNEYSDCRGPRYGAQIVCRAQDTKYEWRCLAQQNKWLLGAWPRAKVTNAIFAGGRRHFASASPRGSII